MEIRIEKQVTLVDDVVTEERFYLWSGKRLLCGIDSKTLIAIKAKLTAYEIK